MGKKCKTCSVCSGGEFVICPHCSTLFIVKQKDPKKVLKSDSATSCIECGKPVIVKEGAAAFHERRKFLREKCTVIKSDPARYKNAIKELSKPGTGRTKKQAKDFIDSNSM